MTSAGVVELPKCLLCRSSTKSAERRKLFSPSTEHVLPLLKEMIGDLKHRILEQSTILCRTCVRSLERLMKLKTDVTTKETELREQISRLRDLYRSSSPVQYAATPPKRSDSDPTLQGKRRLYDTPTRRTLQSMVPSCSSPAVAVSCVILKRLVISG